MYRLFFFWDSIIMWLKKKRKEKPAIMDKEREGGKRF